MTPTGWHGNLDLIYLNSHNYTQLKHSFATAPLKVQRSFYPENDSVCHTILLNTAGGVVGGDNLHQKIDLQNNAHVLITTATATKVYRSNGKIAKQRTNLKIDESACLEWLPQENIIFNGAVYHQDLFIELAPEANWLGWEITRFGRTARGEKFLQGEWRSYTEIWQQGKPLFIDRQYLKAGENTINSYNGLAGTPIVASLIWLGKPVTPEIIEIVRNLCNNNYLGEIGVTQTQSQGLLCRYRGSSSGEVRHYFTEVWQILRQNLLQRSMIKPRVWQT